MRRIGLMSAVMLIVAIHSGSASADWQSMKAKWNCFWDRVCLDWHRNNAWPDPFIQVDRQATRAPIELMVDDGWQLENTIPDELFNPETQELTRAGKMKVRTTLTEMPMKRRMVFVQRGKTDEITETRLRSVEKAATEIMGTAGPGMVALTDMVPRGGSGGYYQRIKTQYENSTPEPRLPAMSGEGDY